MSETETHFYGCQCNDCCSNHFQKQVEDNKSINLCHTDVNNPCYKNHQLVMEKIGFVERALDNYREYRTDIEDLCTDVMYLKEHKNRQIDENRKISKRVDELEEYLREIKLLYSNPLQQQVWQENISKRLEKLEKWKEVAIEDIQFVHDRCCLIEQRIEEIDSSNLELFGDKNDRKRST